MGVEFPNGETPSGKKAFPGIQRKSSDTTLLDMAAHMVIDRIQDITSLRHRMWCGSMGTISYQMMQRAAHVTGSTPLHLQKVA